MAKKPARPSAKARKRAKTNTGPKERTPRSKPEAQSKPVEPTVGDHVQPQENGATLTADQMQPPTQIMEMGAQPRGRPTAYTEAIAERICNELADGKSLPRICEPEDMPAPRTVRQWVLEDREGFSARYARAREAQAWGWADEINDIGDDSSLDIIETDNGPRVNTEVVQRSKLRCDNRKWLLSKLLPKQFGDKLDLNVKDERTDTPEGRKARIAELMALGFMPVSPPDAVPSGV
jgi:hypothetical protein